MDQATGTLEVADKTWANLKSPATALKIAQADLAVAKAGLALGQAEPDLTDLRTPDLASLQGSVDDARDSLELAQIRVSLGEKDALAASGPRGWRSPGSRHRNCPTLGSLWLA